MRIMPVLLVHYGESHRLVKEDYQDLRPIPHSFFVNTCNANAVKLQNTTKDYWQIA